MKWTGESIKEEILNLSKKLGLERMPTSMEMRNNKLSGLSRAIGLNGGMESWSKKTGLPMKKRPKKWTDEAIEREIKSTMDVLSISRMPSSSELGAIGRGDLQNAISKNKGFRYWSQKLKVPLKESTTSKGNRYERIVKQLLNNSGNEVELMSSGHPYDLLVNQNVKIDVKVSTAHNHFGSRAHTFRPSSKHSTCDIYVCIALNEVGEKEDTFIIPSKFVRVKTLNIGINSKYDIFIDRWDYINEYTEFYNSVALGGERKCN